MKKLLLVPLFIILLPLAAIAFVLGLLDNLVTVITRPSFKERLQNAWLANEKYMYLSYDSDSPLKGFYENEIKKKYGKYIVFKTWSDDDKAVTEDGYLKDARWISTRYIQDYDGNYIDNLVTIDKNLGLHSAAQLYDSRALPEDKHKKLDASSYSSEELAAAKKDFESAIKRCLKEWGVET